MLIVAPPLLLLLLLLTVLLLMPMLRLGATDLGFWVLMLVDLVGVGE
jgi:hypothetical protein